MFQGITAQSAVYKPIKGKKNCGSGIVNISNGLWNREERVVGRGCLPQIHIWATCVCMCVSQLVICPGLSTSAGIDSAKSMSRAPGHTQQRELSLARLLHLYTHIQYIHTQYSACPALLLLVNGNMRISNVDCICTALGVVFSNSKCFFSLPRSYASTLPFHT